MIERQDRQLEAIKNQDTSQASVKSRRSQQSINSYRNLINKIQNKKTILDSYYSGPPKFEESVQNQETLGGGANKSSSVSKADMLNLVSDSGNEKSQEVVNLKNKIESQDRIDITKQVQNPESIEKPQSLPFFKPPTSAGHVFKFPQMQPDSQGTKLASA